MIAALAMVLAVASDDPAPPRVHRVSVSASVLGVLPTAGLGELPLAIDTEVGVELVPMLRLLALGSLDDLDIGGLARVRGPAGAFTVSAMLGVEAILTPALPIEVTAGGAIGFLNFKLCSRDLGCTVADTASRGQLRASLGYRFNEWICAGVLVSWNTLIGRNLGLGSWFESGARVSVRL